MRLEAAQQNVGDFRRHARFVPSFTVPEQGLVFCLVALQLAAVQMQGH